jgi:hypothetical protein
VKSYAERLSVTTKEVSEALDVETLDEAGATKENARKFPGLGSPQNNVKPDYLFP